MKFEESYKPTADCPYESSTFYEPQRDIEILRRMEELIEAAVKMYGEDMLAVKYADVKVWTGK